MRRRPFFAASSRPRAPTGLSSCQTSTNFKLTIDRITPNIKLKNFRWRVDEKKSSRITTQLKTPVLLITKHRPAAYQQFPRYCCNRYLLTRWAASICLYIPTSSRSCNLASNNLPCLILSDHCDQLVADIISAPNNQWEAWLS